jgi:hypothetical protein
LNTLFIPDQPLYFQEKIKKVHLFSALGQLKPAGKREKYGQIPHQAGPTAENAESAEEKSKLKISAVSAASAVKKSSVLLLKGRREMIRSNPSRYRCLVAHK